MQVSDEMVTSFCRANPNHHDLSVNEIRDGIAAALNAMWRPIKDAPANTAILIKLPNLNYYGNNGVYAGMLVDMGTGKRWMTFGHAIGRDIGPDDWPAAWQPIPSPPAGEK